MADTRIDELTKRAARAKEIASLLEQLENAPSAVENSRWSVVALFKDYKTDKEFLDDALLRKVIDAGIDFMTDHLAKELELLLSEKSCPTS